MDKSTLPRWGWLLLGLFTAAIAANIVYEALLRPFGLPEMYNVVVVIAAMSLVVIYVGIWYDEKQTYWEHSRPQIFADVVFILTGAILGSSIALIGLLELGLSGGQFLQDVVAMVAGFLSSWGLFWWRNSELYATESS